MSSFPFADFVTRILAALPVPAIAVTSAQTIHAFNTQAAHIFSDGIKGQHITYALRAPDVLQAINEVLTGGPPRSVECRFRGAIQTLFDVNVSSFAGITKNETFALLIFRDSTREQQIEKVRSDFVANASHELRTPLTTLSGFIDTMQGAAKDDEKARGRFLSLMKAQADRMAQLIDDLLSLSRIEMSEHVRPDGEVDLVQLVAGTADLLSPVARENGCELKLQLPASLVVTGDSAQLSQVFQNLIENAIKYSGDGKRVTVTGRIENSFAIVVVSDNGPGIAPHHVPRLTERFYRVSVQDSRNRGGTGLGLAICKHILNRHRGQLTIESTVGEGSAFSVALPKKR